MGREDETDVIPRDLWQQERAEGKVVGVDVPLGGERGLRWFRISAFDQPDRWPRREELGHVVDRPVQVGLQSDSDMGVLRLEAGVEIERPVRIGAAFHVDPEEAVGLAGRAGEALEVGIGGGGVDVKAELRRLDRDLSLDPAGGGQDAFIVLDDVVGVFEFGDILAQQGEEGADALRPEVNGSLQGAVETLTRQEAPDRAAGKWPTGYVGGKPLVLCAPQEEPSHRAPQRYRSG